MSEDGPFYSLQYADPNKLPTEIRGLIDGMVNNLKTLTTDYVAIDEKARSGQRISAQDFQEVDQRYERTGQGLANQLHRAVDAMDIDKPSDFINVVIAHTHSKMNRVLENFQREGHAADLVESVNRSFRKYDLKASPYQENTKDISTQSEGAMVDSALTHNRGLAVGDNHTQTESLEFLSRNMARFKADNVDTIYVESPDLEKWSNLSESELLELRGHREYKNIRLRDPEHIAIAYQTAYAEDVDVAQLDVVIAAKRNGIRLKWIDPKPDTELPNGKNLELMVRIPHSNLVWSDEIEKDRRELHPQGDDGKFIVHGGTHHFTNDKTYQSLGRVDDALGIPTVSFEPSGTASIRRGESVNGADIYLGTDKQHQSIGQDVKRSDNIDRKTAMAMLKMSALELAEEIDKKTAFEAMKHTTPGLADAIDDFRKSGVQLPKDGNIAPEKNAPPEPTPSGARKKNGHEGPD